MVVEEQALLKRVGDAGAMAGQLDRLLSVMSLSRVGLGIVPLSERNAFPSVGFWIYGDTLVGIETPTASIEVSQPREVAMYASLFEQLKASAVYGQPPRDLVSRAIDGLRGSSRPLRQGVSSRSASVQSVAEKLGSRYMQHDHPPDRCPTAAIGRC